MASLFLRDFSQVFIIRFDFTGGPMRFSPLLTSPSGRRLPWIINNYIRLRRCVLKCGGSPGPVGGILADGRERGGLFVSLPTKNPAHLSSL